MLRYPKDKENVTQIAYESWHWRYVGEEHAKKMNELHMCLEEYVEYLRKRLGILIRKILIKILTF